MKKYIIYFGFILNILPILLCYKVNKGSCPTVEPVKDFKMEHFNGTYWYAQDIFESGVKCIVWNIVSAYKDNQWLIHENRYDANVLGVHNGLSEGVLTPKDLNGTFSLDWKSRKEGGKYDFTIYATDYENVAGVFECKNMLIGHRQQGIILSRLPTCDEKFIQPVMDYLTKYDIEVNYFEDVDQSNCEYTVKQ